MHRNAEIVRRAYAAFNAADMQTLNETFHARATWQTPGSSPLAGKTRDRDGTFAQFGRYLEGTGGTFKATLRYVAADEEGRVVGVHHNSGTRDGRKLDTDCCITFRLEDGQIIEGREHFQDQANWDAFWK